MNENYLRYLLSSSNPFSYEMSYEMAPDEMWQRLKVLLDEKKPDITFLKKEGIKSLEFVKPKNILNLNLEVMTTEEMEYFRSRLLESLRVPQRYFVNTDPIYSDEYH